MPPEARARRLGILIALVAWLVLVPTDWNLYSRSHPDWLQEDGIHLTAAGVGSMATLFGRALLDVGIPLPPVAVVTGRLKEAWLGARYGARVVAGGGRAPYRWSFRGVPAGLHASATGQLTGRPRGRTGMYGIAASLVDSLGDHATRRILIRARG